MKAIKIIFFLSLAITLLQCRKNCNDDGFSITAFEQNLKTTFINHTVGFAYCINENGLLKLSGACDLARTSADGSELKMTVDTRINIASISKFITALAAIRAINSNPAIDYHDEIGNVLPTEWASNTEFTEISFDELLSHRSGIQASNDRKNNQTYQELRDIASNYELQQHVYNYQNHNYSMFRILIPYLLNYVPWTADLSIDEACAEIYEAYVQQEVFQKAGNLTGITTFSTSSDAMLYPFPYNNEQGTDSGDWSLVSGAGGWYMSAKQIAQLIAYVWFTESIVTESERLNLLEHPSNLYGLTETINGDHGRYFCKGGGLHVNGAGTRNFCYFMNFPNGVQAVIVTTSTDLDSNNIHGLIRDAFDASWCI